MEAIKKQATKLREQVAKQQQTILRHLGQLGHEAVMVDEAELQCHQRLQNLYRSTRAAKHFQKDIVRGVEGYIATNKKQMQIARKLAEDCCKYGIENATDAPPLAKAASNFGTSHAAMEDQRETMIGIFGQQVSEPLRASINGAPLEDARHLTHRYDKMRQELETQASEVIRRQSKYRDASPESLVKLKNAEARLSDLKSSMLVLGKEAAEAMLDVEEQQQQTTYKKLLTMHKESIPHHQAQRVNTSPPGFDLVTSPTDLPSRRDTEMPYEHKVDAERSYHRNVITLLEKLHSEMIIEEKLNESLLQSTPQREAHDMTSNGSSHQGDYVKNGDYFIAKVLHSFDAQADGELSFEVDDYVVIRQVAPNGWSEGECNGKAGWFPSAYVERTEETPAIKPSKEDSSQ